MLDASLIGPGSGRVLQKNVNTLKCDGMMTTFLLTPQQMKLECLCLNTQRTARAMARHYDAALRPLGLTSGQFAILAALNQDVPVSIGGLADGLGLERTTLTRNLTPLESAGLVRSDADDGDRRVRMLALTQQGRSTLAQAMPLWRAAQTEALKRLKPDSWTSVQSALAQLYAI